MEFSTYAAITGLSHYYGTSFLKPGQLVHLIKDPDNSYDQEAIKAEMIPIGKIGYVANSPHTVPKGCRSAGRIYDSFELRVIGIIRFVMKDAVIVELEPKIEEIYLVHLKEDSSFPLRSKESLFSD